MAKIRTLNFLPEYFQTPTNAQFLAATLDQIVNPPSLMKMQGYVGSKFGYGINATDNYIPETTATRSNYQLAPGVVLTAPNTSITSTSGTATDFITYPGMIDALKLADGVTDDNSKLFTSQFYSWDSFTDLDKLINYTQYYWLPEGPPPVTVAAATVYTVQDYNVTYLQNGYEISAGISNVGSINPQITLLRGGTYTFKVNQESNFWIQGQPGVTGYSPTQPTLYTRNVYGVENNGASNGYVIFTVPQANAQDQYVFSNSTSVDLVSNLSFSQVEGQLVKNFAGIDGVTSLEGLTVLFYNPSITNEIGYTSEYYDETLYDDNTGTDPRLVVPPVTLQIASCDNTSFTLATGSTSMLTVNNTVTFSTSGSFPIFGGVTAGQVYYVNSILNSTQFTITDKIGGNNITLTPAAGQMTLNVNQGLWEEGFYSNVPQNFYTINYVGDPNNPLIRLFPTSTVPLNTNIVPKYGKEYTNVPFYRSVDSNNISYINPVPYVTAPLSTLYYQDGTNPNDVGVIKIIDANLNATIDVTTDIIGQKTYTSPNGVVFTNGLLVNFNGNVIPTNYLQGQYYVQGVGTAIELIPFNQLVCPESFTQEEYIPFDSDGFDDLNYDGELNVPALQDYITIARGSISRNAWSRSNRWFHTDVISAAAKYNNDSNIITTYANSTNRAKRPIIEFYPNLKLFNSGIVGKSAVDYIDTRVTNAFTQVANTYNYYPDIQTYSSYSATIAAVTAATSTTITVPASAVTGSLIDLMFIADSSGLLPVNSQITNITGTTTLTLTVTWEFPQNVSAGSNVSIFASELDVSNYALFPNARVIFANDADPQVRNKIYVAEFSQISQGSRPVITLTVAEDGVCLAEEQTVISRGYYNHGLTYVYNGNTWDQGQQKIYVNQPPLFDIFDKNGISLSDPTIYPGTSFAGCKLFAYGIGSGSNDAILGFPVRYSNINNIGDISFDVSLNNDTFSYINGTTPITEKVNIGYVYNYTDIAMEVKQLGWQTAIADSVQYQVFNYNFDPLVNTTTSFVCDVAALSEPTSDNPGWPTIKVYINNTYVNPNNYTVSVGPTTTTITLANVPTAKTVIQILVLSDQVSNLAYYDIPINLNNNPFNEDLAIVNMGDIRDQYQDIYINAPNTTGPIFGANNYRDLGNLLPYGTKIIQNSASLVLPGAFLRSPRYNIFDALLYNSREYITYKQLIVNTVQNTDYVQRYTPSQILDVALQKITAAKTRDQSFFWSDMLPSQTPYVSNTYTFNNLSSSTFYPLSQIYNFATANYNGVLVYHITNITGVTVEKQLLSGVDYVINTDSPSLEVLINLQAGDQIIIKEYNQTYGSYAPNTPTKLGLYPAFQPAIVLDSNYTNPTWFIKGHDGSYTKLYGTYDQILGVLTDFRDQALFEFENRVFNNLKLSTKIPISKFEIVPGFFRNPTYSYKDFMSIYSPLFLNWVGQNRLDYKTQYYNSSNTLTYNYTNSANRLNNAPIQQGYWRGVYEYFYDTTTPDQTPWEMLGFANEPTWWTTRYGPLPYTSDNGILWGDLEAGYIWNNGNPYINTEFARPGLSKIIPVDTNGTLLSPFQSIIGNYNPSTFQKDWAVGDDAPTEFSYRRSSTYPFDLMKIYALTRPAEFFNLGVDLDNYQYNSDFNQYLVNNRSHLVLSNIEIYGNGTAKTSYINWIVDYQKQQGIDATADTTTLLNNLDVRLVYRLAGFSDKNLLQFYVEKGSPNSNNSSLLIPDESYKILLYNNQPSDRIMYSGVIVQQNDGYWTVYGNSQLYAYFTIANPLIGKGTTNLTVQNISVNLYRNYSATQTDIVPYGTKFYNAQDLAQFLMCYGKYLETQGMLFNDIQNGIQVTWTQMIQEFLYWAQTGWNIGSIITLNPAAGLLEISPQNLLVQPLTIQDQNFILNQNLYPIENKDLAIFRNNNLFSVKTQNVGDAMAYGQFDISNFEHGIVFNNFTLFNDVIYNLVTGLRQDRIFLRGEKSAEWNGTMYAGGFILNQDNVQEWDPAVKYTRGSVVLYKNNYYQAQVVVNPATQFNPSQWKLTNYEAIQIGMLSNPSTRAYESTLFYDINQANLHDDADTLGYSLIGYRPRDYLALLDLTNVAQVQVYQNLIINKGTLNSVSAFEGANLPTGGINYSVNEIWSILSGKFGGTLNNNFIDFSINARDMTGDPSIVSLTDGTINTNGAMQEIPLNTLYNYGTPISSPNFLPVTSNPSVNNTYPNAGFVNFNDITLASYYYAGLPRATNSSGAIVPIQNFYVGQYAWLANFMQDWGVYSWEVVGQILQVRNNNNSTVTLTFSAPHNLARLQSLSIVNFASNVNGYYIVIDVPSIYEAVINLNLNNTTQNSIQGLGIGLTFKSHRVTNPSDIGNLNLTQADFIDNLVWVDNNVDGNWAVLLKANNYVMQNTLLNQPVSTSTFGSAVAYTPDIGYLVGDAAAGNVYRYVLNSLTQEYEIYQTITNGTSFGSEISYSASNDIYVVSQPTGTPEVFIYTLNNSPLGDNLIQYQSAITAPGGVTNWGSAVAISGDANWIYISDITNNNIYVYRRDNIPLQAGYFNTGQTYVITELGSTDFTAIGASYNAVGITFIATGAGTGSGTATQVTYRYASEITGSTYGYTSGDNFSASLSTNQDGSILIAGAPLKNYSMTIEDWGQVSVLNRTEQNFQVQSGQVPNQTSVFPLAWTPVATATITASATNSSNDTITCSTSMSAYAVNTPIAFTGASLAGTGINAARVYYIASISGNNITIKTSRITTTVVDLNSVSLTGVNVYVQVTPLYVSVNGTIVDDSNYAIIGTNLYYYSNLNAGDILNVNDSKFFLAQTFNSNYHDRTGIHFGYAVANANSGSDILVGSPFEISDINGQEGAVYKFSNGGAKYGVVVGTTGCNIVSSTTVLINGYAVNLSSGWTAIQVANAINTSGLINIQAAATSNNNIIIQCIDSAIAPVNKKLVITAFNTTAFSELGFQPYTETQVLQCPYASGPTQFGTSIKIDAFNNMVVSAPTDTRYEGTLFDFVDAFNLSNDTVFDNNATQFVDSYPNAGAVYLFQYLADYNESLTTPGQYVYAQSVNDNSTSYGNSPMYGTALDINDNTIVIGTPNFLTGVNNGQVLVYTNPTGVPVWSVYRNSAPVVDINSIQNSQLYSATSNQTLVNFDYMDPLQGKLLGAARENLDYVTSVDPASYNSNLANNNGNMWGTAQVGQLWLDVTNIRWVNYHQNDVTYNSKYWGSVFPGSDVAVYTWVASFSPPNKYSGSGSVYDINKYCVASVLNSSNVVSPVYYFWVRNTNIIFDQRNKSLSDSIVSTYIANPSASGIPFVAPLSPNTIGLYNASTFFNGKDSIFHIGYSTAKAQDVSHEEFALINQGDPKSFLTGFPPIVKRQTTVATFGNNFNYTGIPTALYERLLYSFSGCDKSGAVVPDPFLPLAVQSGVMSHPRQSFFYDRFLALNNYLTYANSILIQYPIAELRPDSTFLFASGEYYTTSDYWSYTNWWAAGYDNNTKSLYQVPYYADLKTLNVSSGTIVTVLQSKNGNTETYRYDGNGVWTRVGLQNGTIQFNSTLWDYASGQFGWDGNFFDTGVYDDYPSQETYYIIRALNEQIFTEDLLQYRNSSLILMFEYIQSETVESQNFLPWLNKTSLLDVQHTLRELLPYENYVTDNFDFLSGYINETKPYHVLIKDFLYDYKGNEDYVGNLTDFDLPAQYNSTYQKFISPQIVYGLPSNEYEYANTDSIWSTAPYTQWKQNYGVSLTGQPDYLMTTLTSYMDLKSNSMIVENANGFPINGILTIDNEQIQYSAVDTSLNLIAGLTRGYNGTTVSNHFPGAKITINLPPVVLLNGGAGYVNTPKVTAYIDTTLYPPPTVPAQLQAVMGIDSVLNIDVINPGEGYAITPEIVIDPSTTISFTNTAINSLLHTVVVYAPNLQTGNVIQYKAGADKVGIGLLSDNEWYYVNVLQTNPTSVIALYSSYRDAINDKNRIQIYDKGTTNTLSFNLGARAYAISTSYPIRENNITVKFDRTTYKSQVIDWKAGEYYGSFFAGNYLNINQVSSSSIQLESVNPSISGILASAQGAVFEIVSVANNRQTDWSSTIRYVSGTSSSNNAITLIPQDNNNNPSNPEPNASGTTIGFYVGMPVQFNGAVIGGLVANQEYYVAQVISETAFTVSATQNGSVVSLTTATIGSIPMTCLTAQIVDTAVLDINYPGILTVTNTTSGTNYLTVPTSVIGTGGTSSFYQNLPVFFSDGVIGGVVENQVYYISTVIDQQTFTISANENPLTTTMTSTASSTNVITVGSTFQFNVNDPIIFTQMTISGSPVTAFGGIVAGTTYYVSNILSGTTMQISQYINGSILTLSNATGTALITDQIDSVQLTTDTGAMTMNVSLPVSPGQINGQKFTLYGTSGQYPNITSGIVGNLIQRNVNATVANGNNIVAIDSVSGGTDLFYVNMPIQFATAIGGLSSNTTYYVLTYSGQTGVNNIQVNVTGTSSDGNLLTGDDTSYMYVGMSIVFSGQGLGGILTGKQYFVSSIADSTHFTVSLTKGGATLTLTTDNGTMTGVGDPYITVSATAGGPPVTLSNSTTGSVLNQYITSTPTFDMSYILGGYRAIITSAGSGFALNNTITISGTVLGGTTPLNDAVLQVNNINSSGGITSVICSGIVPYPSLTCYLKVISPNQVEVYANPSMTVPVSGINLGFGGFTIDTVNSVTVSNNSLTISDTSKFSVNDAVVFTGNTSTAVSNISPYLTYYISAILNSTQIQVTTIPGGSAITVTSTANTNFTIAKAGSFAFLPEPFFFNQSIVKFNGRVYICVVSNNDKNFVIGKWQILDSDDPRLNAMDRVIGYYAPTTNMPGVDLTQLFDGVTYPNSIYYGNEFQPSLQYPLDTVLQDQPFNNTGLPVPTYDVQGAPFQYGYGPEELVPGVVTDNVAMTVATRPGTDWNIEQYGHSGYNVVSKNLVPTSGTQATYSFAGIAHFPAQIFVQTVGVASGLGTTLNNGIDYTVNWINKTFTLTNPLPYPITETIRLDVYEVGNGNQLIKSNSNVDPIRVDPVSGFNEIYVDCNYSAPIYQGSGVIQPGTYDIDTIATQTISNGNGILCNNLSNLSLNSPITFEGITFGGINPDTVYYVKSISKATNTITISASFNSATGQPGPILDVTDATGTMYVIVQAGTGLTWTSPIIYHNGTKLIAGGTDIVTNTTTGTNAITTNSTSRMVVNTPITFSANMFGPDIVPLQRYYVAQILSSTTFTISATPSGPVLSLTTQQGGATFVTYDYAFGIQPNGTSAMIIFSTGNYTNNSDYLVYSLFGQTLPIQYGYTVPETQLFTGTGSQTQFALSNYVGAGNPSNAIVEVNGLRASPSTYTIDPSADTITFNSAPSNGSEIGVTTFNDTRRQYLNTQTITATNSNIVSQIVSISNNITSPYAVTASNATTSGTNNITVVSTSGFVVGQPVTFQGTSFGGIATDGTVYFVQSIVSSTAFRISATAVNGVPGSVFAVTTATGEMLVTVGGTPAVRVTTNGTNYFTENQLIRIDGTVGSNQLNGNEYYARIINTNVFDLYTTPFSAALNAVNNPVTQISSYISGGYTWVAGSYYLVDTTTSSTSVSSGGNSNVITVASTATLDYGTPVVFTATGSADGTNILGGLIQGTVYYVSTIYSPTQFSVAYSQYGTNVTLSDATGVVNVTQWEQNNPDRLWITINGYRVPSSSLRLYPSNEVGILTSITSGSAVIMTNMIPTATPNGEIYMNFINELGQASVYRANNLSRTWLTQPLYQESDLVYIQDYRAVTNSVTQTSIVPAASGGVYTIGLTGVDKTLITGISVYNNTTRKYISSSNYQITIIGLAPELVINTGSYINAGNSLTITTLIGNTIYINGEQIKFSIVNTVTNTLGGLQRGANGTGAQVYIPEYADVFSILSANKLPDTYYNQTWNSYVYNPTLGDPLQISQTIPATFLEVDIT